MIHRLALFMGGTGAAGVLAVALALGGFGAPLSNGPAFVPVSNDALAGGQRPAEAPTDQPTMSTSLGGGNPEGGPKKVVDTVYVLPAPAPAVVHKPANNANEPAETPRDNNNGDDNNGGNQAGDDQGGDDQAEDEGDGSDDQAGEDDHSNDGDHSDDGGEDDSGHEPGDD